MRSTRKVIRIYLFILFLFATCLAGTTQAKSLYVITRHLDNIVTAYDINGEQIDYQTTAKNLQTSGPVGLALDPDSETLFVTYESSNIIEMVNAKTMISGKIPCGKPVIMV